jgi:hypothetical protein
MMSKSKDQQFREADAAIDSAIATFMSAIDQIEKRHHDGVSILKLYNALADYRASRLEERG